MRILEAILLAGAIIFLGWMIKSAGNNPRAVCVLTQEEMVHQCMDYENQGYAVGAIQAKQMMMSNPLLTCSQIVNMLYQDNISTTVKFDFSKSVVNYQQ